MPRRTNNKPMPVPKTLSSAAAPPPAAPRPMPSAPKPMPAPLQQGPSVTDSIKQGFSFGIGSAIAHNMVNRVFGKPEPALPTTPLPTTTPQQDKMYELYYQCMEKNDKNVNCSDILN
jgi:hypothetical protein